MLWHVRSPPHPSRHGWREGGRSARRVRPCVSRTRPPGRAAGPPRHRSRSSRCAAPPSPPPPIGAAAPLTPRLLHHPNSSAFLPCSQSAPHIRGGRLSGRRSGGRSIGLWRRRPLPPPARWRRAQACLGGRYRARACTWLARVLPRVRDGPSSPSPSRGGRPELTTMRLGGGRLRLAPHPGFACRQLGTGVPQFPQWQPPLLRSDLGVSRVWCAVLGLETFGLSRHPHNNLRAAQPASRAPGGRYYRAYPGDGHDRRSSSQ